MKFKSVHEKKQEKTDLAMDKLLANAKHEAGMRIAIKRQIYKIKYADATTGILRYFAQNEHHGTYHWITEEQCLASY